MDTLRSALVVSPHEREAFEREQRRLDREYARRAEFTSNIDVSRVRMSKAEAKRDRRRQRNLIHCS